MAKATVKLAAEFGMSDVGLAKICRKMDVPKPPLGYWRRIETGADIKPVPLPAPTDKTVRFIFINHLADEDAKRISSQIQAKIESEDLPEKQIKIADTLSDAHPLVEKTKQYYQNANIKTDEPFAPPCGKGYLNLSVSSTEARRALLIADALFKALESRGYDVLVSSNHRGEGETRIVKEGEEVRLSLYEQMRKRQRELTPEEKKKPPYLLDIPLEYELTGKLTIKINFHWSSYQKWSDRKNEPLENRLNEIVAAIVTQLEIMVSEKRRKEDEERRRQEAFRQREAERQRREKLEADAALWRKSENLRDYLNAYEAKLIREKGKIEPGGEESEWLKWARGYADSFDPLKKIASEGE